MPERGGNVKSLSRLVHLSARDFDLLVAYLVSEYFPEIAHPIPFLVGEQGVAKTTTSNLVLRTTEGADAEGQAPPRKEDDWAVVAANSYSIGLDNVSHIQPWLSDALCRAATGAAWSKRQLYTDDDVIVLRVRRVVLLNGIDPRIGRGDLAERLIRFDLQRIDEEHRRGEKDVWSDFRRLHPKVLGALFTLVSQVLAVLPGITLDVKPRMADFATMCAAVDQVRRTRALPHYLGKLTDQLAALTEDDYFGQAIIEMLAHTANGSWTGRMADLLMAVEHYQPNLSPRALEGWPALPEEARHALMRLAVALRANGVEFAKDGPRTSRGQVYKLKMSPWPPEPPQANGGTADDEA
jgi:hypothetical protein